MQIVKAGDDGAFRAEFADESKCQGEHLTRSPSTRHGELGERLERGQRADVALSLDLTDQIHERCERDRVPTDLHATTEIQRCGRESRRLKQQRRFPDSWVAADEHHPWLAFGGSLDRTLEHGELIVASHDRVISATTSHHSEVLLGGRLAVR